MSKIQRGGKWVRPGFNWTEHEPSTPTDSATGQVVESIRNCLEQIRDSQALSCSTISLFRDIKAELRGLRRELKTRRRRPVTPKKAKKRA